MTAHYQGAQCSRWCHPRYARQSATPVRHDSSATEYHNAYAVDPTVYAATYTASTGTSTMGQVKTPLGQRVYRTMKRIWQEILNHCNTIRVIFSILYILVGPTCRGPTPVYASPLRYKRETPVRKELKSKQGTWRQRVDSSTNTRAIQLSVDVGYYAPAARTTLNPRVFLCACFMSRSVKSLALTRVNTLWD